MSSSIQGFFITGTDTNVGKTYVSCLLAKQLIADGYSPIPRKPVESGCKKINGELLPADALALQQACNSSEPLNKICPYPLKAAISPAEAARQESKPILLDDLYNACTAINYPATKTLLLVEGAGGFYSPLCENGLNADLAEKLALPVILVAEDRLGCINHILLSIEAIISRQLQLSCIILNQIKPSELPMNNATELASLVRTPIILTKDLYGPHSIKQLLNTLK